MFSSAASAGRRLTQNEWKTVGLVTVGALFLRALFLPFYGYPSDILKFASWLSTLSSFGIKAFYSHGVLKDYPPAAYLVLWVSAQMDKALAHHYLLLSIKLPAIIADVGIAYITYLIVRRTWTKRAALITMIIVAFNPVYWFISAYWGQNDSLPAMLALWAIYLAVTDRFELAWATLVAAGLIKPHPIVIAPLLLAWQIHRQSWTWRLLLVPVIAISLAYLASLGFAPTHNPHGVLSWLYQRYAMRIDRFAYNSNNAFNVYAVWENFKLSDDTLLAGFPQRYWGIAVFGSLLLAVLVRMAGGKDTTTESVERRFYMACFSITLGFFMLTTRMHERHNFDAMAIAPLVWNSGLLQRIVVALLWAIFIVNLLYSRILYFIPHPAHELAPGLVHSLSLLNVLCLLLIVGVYLVRFDCPQFDIDAHKSID